MPTLNEDRINNARRTTYEEPTRYRAIVGIFPELTRTPPRRRLSFVWPIIALSLVAFWSVAALYLIGSVAP